VGTIFFWVFWISTGLLLYIGLGYPFLVTLRSLLVSKPVKRSRETPLISVIIPAYNEEGVIIEKLDNTLSLGYPIEFMEVLVASDGSEDGTNELVEAYPSPAVRLLTLPRQGKNNTLNSAAEEARGQIIVITDADTALTPDALPLVVAPFRDPEVGGVGGERRPARVMAKISKKRPTWYFKHNLNQMLSKSGSMTAGVGQLYSVRRELFRPIPPGVSDDLYTSLQVVSAGRRLIFEPGAVGYPFAGHTTLRAPFQRKVRVATRSLRCIWLMRHLLNPLKQGFYAVQLWQKVLRFFLILPFLLMSITSLLIWKNGKVYQAFAVGLLGFHFVALLGFLLRNTRLKRSKLFMAPYTFYWTNIASLVALKNLLAGESQAVWAPQRSAVKINAED
jgi:cellulose synthase/poly-beta-1,6-N-acetylglucosamine synthase-like glycosyltransferase